MTLPDDIPRIAAHIAIKACVRYRIRPQYREDVESYVAYRIWRSLARYDPAKATLRTFVFVVGYNAALDFWRRHLDLMEFHRGRTVSIEDRPCAREAAWYTEPPPVWESAEAVAHVLRRITPMRANTLRRTVMDGDPQDALAAEEGVTRQAVSLRARLACEAARKVAEAHDIYPTEVVTGRMPSKPRRAGDRGDKGWGRLGERAKRGPGLDTIPRGT